MSLQQWGCNFLSRYKKGFFIQDFTKDVSHVEGPRKGENHPWSGWVEREGIGETGYVGEWQGPH